MARIVSSPKGMTPKIDYSRWQEQDQEYTAKLEAYCKQQSPGDPLAGQIVSEPVADNYANYMVLSSKPLVLVHMDLGDGYSFRWASKWNLKDIKQMIAQKESWAKLWK